MRRTRILRRLRARTRSAGWTLSPARHAVGASSTPGRRTGSAVPAPVVLWGGWPFFVRGWQSIVNRSLNMFTLIALGTATAFGYSVLAVLLPDALPQDMRHGAVPPVYFEAAAVITTLVLLGQVL